MANGIPDYSDAIKPKADVILCARIRRLSKSLPIVCPCTKKQATNRIQGSRVDYLFMTCPKCKVSSVWLMDKKTGETVISGTKLYNRILDYLIRGK